MRQRSAERRRIWAARGIRCQPFVRDSRSIGDLPTSVVSAMTLGTQFNSVMTAARTGAPWALEALYSDLQPRVLRYLRVHEPGVAEDLASDTWIGVAKGVPGFLGGEEEFHALVFTVARRRVLDHRRTEARRRTAPSDPGSMEGLGPVADAESDAMDRLGEGWALRLVSELPPTRRTWCCCGDRRPLGQRRRVDPRQTARGRSCPSTPRDPQIGSATRRGGRNAMTFYRDVPDDMMSANDVELADALLEGALDTAEAPSYAGVAELIHALDEGPDEDLDPERTRATVAAMAAVIDALRPPRGCPRGRRPPRAAALGPAKVAGVALAAVHARDGRRGVRRRPPGRRPTHRTPTVRQGRRVHPRHQGRGDLHRRAHHAA